MGNGLKFRWTEYKVLNHDCFSKKKKKKIKQTNKQKTYDNDSWAYDTCTNPCVFFLNFVFCFDFIFLKGKI